jgi:hypothetical protein
MKNTRYVRKAASGNWEVTKEGHVRPTGRSRTKGGAIEAARDAVREDGGGEVLVLNRTGKVVESDLIARPKRAA